MKYDPSIHHRRSIRLPGFDYSQSGAYFVTICTHGRLPLFGQVVNGEMILNWVGQIVREELIRTESIRSEIRIACYVIMPNHIHCIIWIEESAVNRRRGDRPVAPTTGNPSIRRHSTGPANRSIGAFVGGFKSAVTKRINEIRHNPGQPVWQRNYYEHIIRDDEDYERITEYILANPLNWEKDDYHLD